MTGPVTRPSAHYGVHSEVGQLRKVLVCAPGLAHERLTPSNRDGLLFDEVMWVQNARRDHLDFMTKMRDRGIDVVELHDLLSATLTIPEAKAWLLDRNIVPNEVGLGLVEGTRAFLESKAPRALAEYLIGGLSTFDLPEEFRAAATSPWRASPEGWANISCRRCPTRSTRGTPHVGSTAESRSTRCTGRPGKARPSS